MADFLILGRVVGGGIMPVRVAEEMAASANMPGIWGELGNHARIR